MPVIIAALSILSLSASVLSQARQPDPCLGASVPFVNDWTSCASYFWCRPAAQGGTTPTAPCRTGLGFDEARQNCNIAAALCTACPVAPHDPIAVGDATDLTCRRFFFCVNGIRTVNPQQCGDATRFNRVTGMCDMETNVPCFGASI